MTISREPGYSNNRAAIAVAADGFDACVDCSNIYYCCCGFLFSRGCEASRYDAFILSSTTVRCIIALLSPRIVLRDRSKRSWGI